MLVCINFHNAADLAYTLGVNLRAIKAIFGVGGRGLVGSAD